MKSNNSKGLLQALLGVGGIATAGILWILLGLFLSAVSLAVSCLVIYFFLAAGGLLPPLDFIPFVPYV